MDVTLALPHQARVPMRLNIRDCVHRKFFAVDDVECTVIAAGGLNWCQVDAEQYIYHAFGHLRL